MGSTGDPIFAPPETVEPEGPPPLGLQVGRFVAGLLLGVYAMAPLYGTVVAGSTLLVTERGADVALLVLMLAATVATVGLAARWVDRARGGRWLWAAVLTHVVLVVFLGVALGARPEGQGLRGL